MVRCLKSCGLNMSPDSCTHFDLSYNSSDLQLTSHVFLLGNGITLEGAVPTEQDSQPKPAKRARTSFTAEQLQVGSYFGAAVLYLIDTCLQRQG